MTYEEIAENYIKQDGTNGEKVWEKINKEFPNSFIVKTEKSKTRLAELLCEYTRVVFIDGLAEGERIGKEKQWIATEKAQKKTSEKIRKLEKENKISEEIIIGEQQEINRLEKEIKQIIERERVVPEHYLCKMIEKIHCCQMCKHLLNGGSCLEGDTEEVKKWDNFLIETRRKNFCKNWELANENNNLWN